MRKILVFIFLFLFLSANAQLQRTILGNNLGVTKKAQVIQNMKNKGKRAKTVESNLIIVENVEFGGKTWPSVYFRFYNQVLFHVYFQDIGIDIPREKLDLDWTNLSSALKRKYSIYMNEISSENLEFDDSKTFLCAKYNYYQGYKVISLTYFDKKLMMQEIQSGEDEL